MTGPEGVGGSDSADVRGGRSGGRGSASGRAAAASALTGLASDRPELASAIGRVVAVVVEEARGNPRFADALTDALGRSPGAPPGEGRVGRPRGARRTPGPWDPFAVYAEHGEAVLRERLEGLELEQLRNVVAEHGMDTDRLAMKWRDPDRVVNRIVERVVARAAKGDGFRPPG